MPSMCVLDIGRGFVSSPTFDAAIAVTNDALACHFGDLPCVEVIGDPSRYFGETTSGLAMHVIGKHTRRDMREYWIDDGLYDALNCIIVDHYVPASARHRPADSSIYGIASRVLVVLDSIVCLGSGIG
ncbi:hypothetical protein BS78_08G154800 [Paspalum vaginatum]|nr:hypothetical protein BS78_08G154800 [Paspalum vaginatum]